ncbi:MAG: acyl carrier protein [Geminicoccaceae bacterium]
MFTDTEVMSDGQAVLGKICDTLERYKPEGVELTASTELSADLNIDSVAAMDLIMEIEDRFGIDIPLNLVSDLRNVRDLVEVVRQQIEGR